jgi:hypothetical protein
MSLSVNKKQDLERDFKKKENTNFKKLKII